MAQQPPTTKNYPTRKPWVKPAPKKEEPAKKPEAKDFSKVLTVIASIRSTDVTMNTTKKIEEWMREMGKERAIVFAGLCKLPQERIEPIILQIISKSSPDDRKEITESYDLYSLEVNTEKYSKILLEVETKNPTAIAMIDRWLETLTPCQANYFKSSLSGMQVNEGVERCIYLLKLPDDAERTKNAQTLNLMF